MILEGNKNIIEICFTYFAIANLYYSLFNKHLEDSSLRLQVFDNANHYINTTYYSWYDEFVKDFSIESDLDYNEKNNNMDYKKNFRDEKSDDIIEEKKGKR